MQRTERVQQMGGNGVEVEEGDTGHRGCRARVLSVGGEIAHLVDEPLAPQDNKYLLFFSLNTCIALKSDRVLCILRYFYDISCSCRYYIFLQNMRKTSRCFLVL